MMNLTDSIDQIVRLLSDEKEAIEVAYAHVELSKGELWIRQGMKCDHVAYVVSGQLRNHYLDEAGHDVTCFFVAPGSFITSFTSFLTNTPTNENVSALEHTILRIISRDELERLSDSIPKLHIFRRVIAENLFITLERRIAMLQSQNARDRYERMLQDSPDVILSVPLQYIASFLGITPQHFSRLRKELNQ